MDGPCAWTSGVLKMNRMMSSPQQLCAIAEKLERKAQRANDPTLGSDLLTIARGYRELAERKGRQNRERNN
jgi:hypothetical protein